MTVHELITELQKLNPELPVMIQQGCEYDYDYMPVETIQSMDLWFENDGENEFVPCVVIQHE